MSKRKSYLTRFHNAGPRPLWIRYFLLIGAFFFILQWLLGSPFSQSSLVYVLVPYLVGVGIYLFIPQPKGRSRTMRFLRHMLAALVVMLGTSVLLREGIICVAMFLPIYLAFSGLYFAFAPVPREDPDKVADIFKSSFVPFIVLLMSLEGVSETLSFDRDETIIRSRVVQGDVAQLKSNLEMPIHMEEGRSLFLRLFPLPYEVNAGSLREGDIHIARFRYDRWLVTNTHFGETAVEITEVSPRRIRTQIVKDSSYFSKYLTINDTQIDFEDLGAGQTRVTLTINYTRDLDPAWYFGPLQRRAMRESADYLIANVIARDAPLEVPVP